MVDQGLHRGAHDLLDVVEGVALAVPEDRELAGPGDLLVGDHDRAGPEVLEAHERLLDDLERLVALLEAQRDAVVRVGAGARRHVEVVRLVAAVRLRLAHVVRQAGRAEHGAGHAEAHARREVEVPDAHEAALEDGVRHHEVAQLAEVLRHRLVRRADLGDDARREV